MNVFRAPAGFTPDDSGGRDLLDTDAEAATLASLIAARMTAPPLSLGLFGAAASGVSFFMHRVRDRVDRLTADAREHVDGPYLRNVVQVEYNAWHYAGSNAWMGLVEVVFNALDRWMEESSRQGAAADGVMFDTMGTAQRLCRELETEVTRAQVVAKRAEAELYTATGEHDAAMQAVGTAVSRAKWDEVTAELSRRFTDKPLEAAEINADGKCFGFEGLSGTPEEMDKILEQAKTVAGRAGLLTSSLIARRHASNAFVVAVGMLILVAGALVLGRLFATSPTTATAIDAGGKAITILSTAIGIVGLWLAAVARNQTLGAIVRLRTREPLLREVVRRVEGAIAYDVAVAQERLVSLRKRVDDARAQLAPARAALARAEQALDDYKRDRVLRRVTEFYREQIRKSSDGISSSVIPIIRDDFAALAEWAMHRQWESRSEREHRGDRSLSVERIVIYIDDLDRCPPETAVDVLQAMQLLLAFPLFVVVVATDPRWLMRAVAPRYRRILGRGGDGMDGRNENTGTDAENDSIAYLSRVFQIPFWVRPLDRAAARRVALALLPSRRAPRRAEPTAPIVVDGPPDAMSTQPEAPAATFSSIGEITAAEIEAIERAAGLAVQSVRDASRLVMGYRLLRAGLPASAQSAFGGAPGERGAFRAVATQLAIVGAAPQLTRRYFAALTTPHLRSVTDLLQRLAGDGSIVNHPEWETLVAVLEDYRRDGDDEKAVQDLIAWYGAAARHSFATPTAYPARPVI